MNRRVEQVELTRNHPISKLISKVQEKLDLPKSEKYVIVKGQQCSLSENSEIRWNSSETEDDVELDLSKTLEELELVDDCNQCNAFLILRTRNLPPPPPPVPPVSPPVPPPPLPPVPPVPPVSPPVPPPPPPPPPVPPVSPPVPTPPPPPPVPPPTQPPQPLILKKIDPDSQLVTLIIMNRRVEQVEVNINAPVGEVIKRVCSTMGLAHPSNWYFCKPYGFEVKVDPSPQNGKFPETAYNLHRKLDDGKLLRKHLYSTKPPYILYMGCYNNGVMGEDEVDGILGGQSIINNIHKIFLSWYKITQDYYPLIKDDTAARVAAILCHAKFTDEPRPSDGELKDAATSFLPTKCRKKSETRKTVVETYRTLPRASLEEAAQQLLRCVEPLPVFDGVFFPVKVKGKYKMLKIPRLVEGTLGIGSKEIVLIYRKSIDIREKPQVYPYDKIQSVQITKAHNLVIEFGGHTPRKYYAKTTRTFDIVNLMRSFLRQLGSELPFCGPKSEPSIVSGDLTNSPIPSEHLPELTPIDMEDFMFYRR